MNSRRTKAVTALILVFCMVASLGVTMAFAKDSIKVGGTANEGTVDIYESVEDFVKNGIEKEQAKAFAVFECASFENSKRPEIETMAYVEAPASGYIVFHPTGNCHAYTNEECTSPAKVYYTKDKDGVKAGNKDKLYNCSNTTYYMDVQKGDKLYFTGSKSWDTNLFVGFIPANEKVAEPLVKIAGTNVIAGYASPNAIVSVKQGKKTFTGTADENGFYAIKINKLKKKAKLTLWQNGDKDNAITVKIK